MEQDFKKRKDIGVGMMCKKEKSAKRIEGILFTLCLFFVFLCGCNKQEVQNTTLAISKNGKITQTVVEEFPTGEYDLEELKKMNETEVSQYNTSVGKEAVRVEGTELKENKIVLRMEYADANAYFDMNGNVFFYGTIQQAKQAGYTLEETLSTQDGQEQIAPQDWSSMDERHIVIVSEPVAIKTYANILYYSSGVTIQDKKLATVAEDTTAYIVFK